MLSLALIPPGHIHLYVFQSSLSPVICLILNTILPTLGKNFCLSINHSIQVMMSNWCFVFIRYMPRTSKLLQRGLRPWTCVNHLILPGTVAAGEFGLDHHRVQTAEGRTRSKEFLSLMVKKLVTDDRLKHLPLVLHVREARQSEEEAASQCIGALRMASFPRQRKIYLHCFCGSTKVAHFWIGAYPHVKFGVSPKNISGNQPSAQYFQSCNLKSLMLETDAPSLFFDPRKPDSSNDDKGPPTTPQSTYEVACWLARLRNQPVSEVLEAAANNFEEFYGWFWWTGLLLFMLYNISICVQMPWIYCILSLCSFYVLGVLLSPIQWCLLYCRIQVYHMWQMLRYTCIIIVFMFLCMQYIICGQCRDILAWSVFCMFPWALGSIVCLVSDCAHNTRFCFPRFPSMCPLH